MREIRASIINKFKNPWEDDNKTKSNLGKDEIGDLINNFKDRINRLIQKRNLNKFDKQPSNINLSKIILIVFAIIITLWFLTGFYIIQPDEEGVVITLGKYNRTSSSGLNYKLPNPFETLTKVSVTRVNKEEIGFRSAGKRITTREQLLQNTVSTESQMLTTDENIVDINFEVQWQISSSKDFLFNVKDSGNENTVKTVAESAMRESIGLTKIGDVLAEERSKIETDAKILMQAMLDNYKIGVKILRVQLLRVEPPQEVIDAYRNVQDAKQDKEQEINKAYAYRNDIVPRARGESEKILLESDGYKQQVIAEATGDAQRFTSIYNQYKNAKEVTRKRMYLETIENILSNVDKIILDKNSSSNLLTYLPLLDQKNVLKSGELK